MISDTVRWWNEAKRLDMDNIVFSCGTAAIEFYSRETSNSFDIELYTSRHGRDFGGFAWPAAETSKIGHE